MQNFTTSPNVETAIAVQEISGIVSDNLPTNTLCYQIDAISVNSDVATFLETIKALAHASEANRNAVAAWCERELSALDASIEGQRADGN